ncbi:MAG: glycosyltransferase family 39 protein [Thermodesulfobacteriota bacterium]
MKKGMDNSLEQGLKAMAPRITFFLVTVGLTAAAGMIPPRSWVLPVFNHGGYYFILTAFVIWVMLIIRETSGRIGALCRAYYPGFILSLGIMALAFHLTPPQFKILSDETNLVGVSMAMHEDKTVSLPHQGLGIDYSDYDYTGSIDQRPLGFPFFISLCHGFLGYSPYNGFVVNFAAGVLTLVLIYVMLTMAFSSFYGILGIFLTVACPVFIFWATSGGFETLNLFFVVFVLFSLYRFMRSRRVDRAELLFLSLVLLAHCRYESAIFIAGLLVLAPYFIDRQTIGQYRLPTLLCPVLLLPLIWQRRLCFFSPGVQSGDARLMPDSLFGLGNLADHFGSNFFVLFGLDAGYGFVPAVFILAAAGIYSIVKRMIQTDDRLAGGPARSVIVYALVCGISLFLLYAAFYWGDFTTAVDNRLAMVFLPFLVIPAVYAVYRLSRQTDSSWRGAIILLVIVQVVYYWPVAEKQTLVQGKALTYEYKRVLDYLERSYQLDREKLLIISDRTNLYTIHRLGSVDFNFANGQVPLLRFLKQIYFDHILVLQRPDVHTREVRSDQSLLIDYRLRPLAEIPVGPDYFVRVSEADMPAP